jgi:hypothetical protein
VNLFRRAILGSLQSLLDGLDTGVCKAFDFDVGSHLDGLRRQSSSNGGFQVVERVLVEAQWAKDVFRLARRSQLRDSTPKALNTPDRQFESLVCVSVRFVQGEGNLLVKTLRG